MLLALASAASDANDIINSPTVFIRLTQIKQCATDLFWSCDASESSQCHMMPTVSLIAPFHFLCQDDKKEVQHDMTSFIMWSHLHQQQHHVIPMAPSVALLYLFSQDNQNDMQHDFLVMWYIWCWHGHGMM